MIETILQLKCEILFQFLKWVLIVFKIIAFYVCIIYNESQIYLKSALHIVTQIPLSIFNVGLIFSIMFA